MNDNIKVGICGCKHRCAPPTTYKTIILKPNCVCGHNTLTQEMLSEKNTKYVIKYDFTLGGEKVIVPEECILEFDGGSLRNGTIVGQDTVFINVGDVNIWGENLTTEGTWKEHSGGGGDKPYDPEAHSGLGRKTLKLKDDGSNILTHEDFDAANTIYVIQYDFTLGEDIELGAGCTLKFDGGSISGNGNNKDSITGNNLRIDGNDTVLKDMYIVATGSCEIKNLTINYTNAIKDSVSITSANHVDIKNVGINVDGNNYTTIEVDGIHVEDSENITIENCIINGTKSHYTDSEQGAIFISDSENINIIGCTALNAKAECLTTRRCVNVNITNCYISDCSGSAISTLGDSVVRLSAISAKRTGASTISINSNNVTVSNCLLKDNGVFSAVTLGHDISPVSNAILTGNTIITEHNAVGGYIIGDVIISNNNIQCEKAFSFDTNSNAVANISIIGNNIVEGEEESRLSLSRYNIIICDNVLQNVKFTGYLLDSQLRIENNIIKGSNKVVCAFNGTPKFVSIKGNCLFDCDYSEIETNAELFEFSNVQKMIVDDNYINDISALTQRLFMFSIDNPENADVVFKNNYIKVKSLGIAIRIYDTDDKNNKLTVENNNVNCENTNGYVYLGDGHTVITGHSNFLNSQYRGMNPDGSTEPDEILIYNEDSFSRLQQNSKANIVRNIDNVNTVEARACLDFTFGCKILGDVHLNDTKIIPDGCKISDYILGTITGNYAAGQCLFDETSLKPKWWDGTNWIDGSGNVIS